MNQYTWTYLGDGGYSEVVGLYHSSKSGHLMIYVGKKVVVVDFSVKDSKTYSFFINDELCEVQLERKDLKMFYHFKINKEVDTPRNKARKKTERKYFKQSLAFMTILVAAIVLAAIYFNATLRPQQAMIELAEHPGKTVAQIKINSKTEPPTLTYVFIANNEVFTSSSNYFELAKSLRFNVLPLESGDEFEINYAPSDPNVNRIYFEKPTEKQVEVYSDRVFRHHLTLNPNVNVNKEACKFGIAYRMHGFSALADYYYQQTSTTDNPTHNKNSYLRLTRSLPFTKEVDKNCW